MTSRGNGAARQPGERELIGRILQRLPPAPATLVVGPGDDAAVVTPPRGALQVLTTDALVEGIHFDRRFSSLADVGYKAVAVNVSDVAAMGAAPDVGLLSLILPDWVTLADLDALLDGVIEMSAVSRLTIAGGNISRSPGPLVVDVTATGRVGRRRILTRSGGRPGDALYLTGAIGAAAAGLDILRAHEHSKLEVPDGWRTCVARHRRPEPRVRIGTLLGRNRAASACIDLSDGLADAVARIAEASGTGAVVWAPQLPIEPAAAEWFASRGEDPVTAAVRGGDDYELLFAVPSKRRGRFRGVESGARGVPLTRIGELTREPGVFLQRDGRKMEMPAGFVHF